MWKRGNFPFSNSATLHPPRARIVAAVLPAGPPPMIATSYCARITRYGTGMSPGAMVKVIPTNTARHWHCIFSRGRDYPQNPVTATINESLDDVFIIGRRSRAQSAEGIKTVNPRFKKMSPHYVRNKSSNRRTISPAGFRKVNPAGVSKVRLPQRRKREIPT